MTIKLNVIDLPKSDYQGGKSTLCPGCGHDQISNVIINAAWENGLKPEKLAKMSGIGCSSKTPAYFLGQSHGFNTVHYVLYTGRSAHSRRVIQSPIFGLCI